MTVGNITVGGTGKTPLIAKIVREAASDAIYISRGYGTSSACSVTGGHATYETCGDEATLLARRFPNLRIIVGSRKEDAVRVAASADSVVIVDDGLQHDEIDFDLKVATIDVKNPYGYGWLLPRGLLREDPESRLRDDVDYIVLTNCSDLQEVASFQYSDVPIIAMRTECVRFFMSCGTAAHVPPDGEIYLISGIARPDRMRTALNGCVDPQRIRGHLQLFDHAPIVPHRITRWLQRQKPSSQACLIATEKDWVRFAHWDKMPLPVYFMEIAMHVISGFHDWDTLCSKVRNREKEVCKNTLPVLIEQEKVDLQKADTTICDAALAVATAKEQSAVDVDRSRSKPAMYSCTLPKGR